MSSSLFDFSVFFVSSGHRFQARLNTAFMSDTRTITLGARLDHR